jgi:hypothetical protein
MRERRNQEPPKFYDLLSFADQEGYNQLRSNFSSDFHRNRRGSRLPNFAEMIGSIRTYCIRNADDDWKRCLVCGVCWLSNGIAFNTRQLCIICDKCKSSINGVLHQLGYANILPRFESNEALAEAMPILKSNFNQLIEWTVRPFAPPCLLPMRSAFPQDPGQPMGIPMLSKAPKFRTEMPGSYRMPSPTVVQKSESRMTFPLLQPPHDDCSWQTQSVVR